MADAPRRRPVTPPAVPGLGGGVRALGGLALAAFPMLALWAGIGAGVVSLWRTALVDPAFRVGGETQDIGGATDRCPEAVAELVRLGAAVEGRSLYDPALARDLRALYEASPWIREVREIRRLFPNRIEITYRLRNPVAQVLHQHRYWLLDVEGRLLPVAGQRAPAVGLPLIVGASADALGPRPAEGRIWGAPGVRDALGLMLTLWSSALPETMWPSRVTVDSSAFADARGQTRRTRPRLEVDTRGGRLVRWGTFNAGDLPDEPTSPEKLRTLAELLHNDPAAGAGAGVGTSGLILDVRTRVPGYALPPRAS